MARVATVDQPEEKAEMTWTPANFLLVLVMLQLLHAKQLNSPVYTGSVSIQLLTLVSFIIVRHVVRYSEVLKMFREMCFLQGIW